MPIFSRSPAYNLKAVLKETGLKADILRAWERRYELPQPQRTSGGHRLYSEFDIETLKWLRARQAEGLSISRAVERWKEIVEIGHDPLAELSPASTSPAPDRLPADTSIDRMRQKWVETNLAFDSIQVDEVLNQAFAIYPVETVCTEILQRGLSDIGNDWYLGKTTVQQEHFASALANRRLETLIAATPPATRPQSVLVGCPPGERHTFSIMLLSLMLCRRGFKVVYLGADVPIEQLGETSALIKPDLVILAAQQLTSAAALQSSALTLQGRGIPLAYGGLIFNRVPRLRDRIPGHFLGEKLKDAIPLIERLLDAPSSSTGVIHMDGTHPALASLYREKRPLVEITVLEELNKIDLPTEYLLEAKFFFGEGLQAALELGEPDFLDFDLEWVNRLLGGRQIPAERLNPFLAAYSLAVLKVMGKSGGPIIDWIGSHLSQNKGTHP